MAGPISKSPPLKSLDHRDAVERVRAWTRARFGLPVGAMIVVGERPGTVPGGPPFETVVAFWEPPPGTADEVRYHFRVFKRVADIAEDDLPFAWLKPALAAIPDFQCECC
jgi:nitrate reductase delta subunit